MKLQIIVSCILKKYTRLYGFWFLSIRFAPKYFLKMNISVNLSDLRSCSNCWKCDLRPSYFAQTCKRAKTCKTCSTCKIKEMPFQRPKIQKFSGRLTPRPPATYFNPPSPPILFFPSLSITVTIMSGSVVFGNSLTNVIMHDWLIILTMSLFCRCFAFRK